MAILRLDAAPDGRFRFHLPGALAVLLGCAVVARAEKEEVDLATGLVEGFTSSKLTPDKLDCVTREASSVAGEPTDAVEGLIAAGKLLEEEKLNEVEGRLLADIPLENLVTTSGLPYGSTSFDPSDHVTTPPSETEPTTAKADDPSSTGATVGRKASENDVTTVTGSTTTGEFTLPAGLTTPGLETTLSGGETSGTAKPGGEAGSSLSTASPIVAAGNASTTEASAMNETTGEAVSDPTEKIPELLTTIFATQKLLTTKCLKESFDCFWDVVDTSVDEASVEGPQLMVSGSDIAAELRGAAAAAKDEDNQETGKQIGSALRRIVFARNAPTEAPTVTPSDEDSLLDLLEALLEGLLEGTVPIVAREEEEVKWEAHLEKCIVDEAAGVLRHLVDAFISLAKQDVEKETPKWQEEFSKCLAQFRFLLTTCDLHDKNVDDILLKAAKALKESLVTSWSKVEASLQLTLASYDEEDWGGVGLHLGQCLHNLIADVAEDAGGALYEVGAHSPAAERQLLSGGAVFTAAGLCLAAASVLFVVVRLNQARGRSPQPEALRDYESDIE